MNNQIFVFGSNLAGRHGKGSALEAKKKHGAITGVGEGRQGSSYAIPTKDHKLNILSIAAITLHIDQFLNYALRNPDLTFNIVDVGCGLAGYKPEQIAPLFTRATANCNFSPKFNSLIEKQRFLDWTASLIWKLDETILTFNESEKGLILDAFESLLIPDPNRMTGICFGVRCALMNAHIPLSRVDKLVWSFFPLWPNDSGFVGYPVFDTKDPISDPFEQFEYHYNQRSLWRGEQGRLRTDLVKFMIQELKMRMGNYE